MAGSGESQSVSTDISSDPRERILRVLNFDEQKHTDGGWYVRFPGFKYDDFNRAGFVDIAKVDRMAQTVRRWESAFGDVGLLLFTVGRHWKFSRRLYQRAAVRCPMTMRRTINGIGQSSVDQCHAYFIDNNDDGDFTSATSAVREPLAYCVHRLVNVDPKTHKSRAFSSAMVDSLRSAVVEGGERFPVFDLPSSTIPDRTFSCRIQVRFDDMDFLYHTNVGSYISFALECASRAAEARFYHAIQTDVAFYQAKMATVVFLSESRAGDQLDVSTWEDDVNKLLLYFTIRKLGKMIAFARVEYYSDPVDTISRL